MRRYPHRIAVLLTLLAAVPAGAEEPAANAVPAPATAASPAPAPPAAEGRSGPTVRESPVAAPPAATGAPAPAARPAPASPQRFNPSERVRADYPVAFPIDI
jgi:hypothetical protein